MKPPTSSTLQSYGLTVSDWWEIVRRQNGKCPVCGEALGDRMLAVDHEHVRGFKARKLRRGKNGKKIKVRVMPPEQRRSHVRGVLHSFCNRYVRGWLTLKRAVAIVAYLKEHEERRPV